MFPRGRVSSEQILQKTAVVNDSCVFSERKPITRFQTMRFPANKRRTRDSENWKKKNCPNSVTERSSTEGRPQRCFGSVGTELNWKTLVFLTSRWISILLALFFVKFVWRKIVAIAVAFHCCGLYIERAAKNKTNNGGYRLVWESLNCWIFSFSTSYGTIYVSFHSWFCRICFDWATARLFVGATHFFD